MKIKRKNIYLKTLQLKKPFEHGSFKRNTNTTLFVKLTNEHGQEGYGECLPREYVTGETIENATENLGRHLSKIPTQLLSLEEITEFLHELEPENSRNMAALCGTDMALLDLYAKSKNKSISEILREEKGYQQTAKPRVTSGPLGLSTPAWKKELYCLAGINNIKLKINPETSPERINRIGSGFFKPNTLRLDGNCSLNEKQLIKLLRETSVPILYVEQPFATGTKRQIYGIGLMADESLVSIQDARQINFDAASIRIGKNGGILRTLDVINEWGKRGKPYMLGSLVGETSLLSAALLHVASITNPSLIEGCYSPILLKQDPTDKSPRPSYKGKIKFDYTKPGLGINLDFGK